MLTTWQIAHMLRQCCRRTADRILLTCAGKKQYQMRDWGVCNEGTLLGENVSIRDESWDFPAIHSIPLHENQRLKRYCIVEASSSGFAGNAITAALMILYDVMAEEAQCWRQKLMPVIHTYLKIYTIPGLLSAGV